MSVGGVAARPEPHSHVSDVATNAVLREDFLSVNDNLGIISYLSLHLGQITHQFLRW